MTNEKTTDSAASALSAGLGAMLRDGMRFVEAKPIGNAPPNYACEGCAFVAHPVLCAKAIDGAAKSAFGGDCAERDVIYVEAPNSNYADRAR